jgi:peroxidase
LQGCDASVLIRSASNDAEVDNSKNQGLRGQDVVDAAKAQLEDQCPGVVSCADILALAARDAVAMVQRFQGHVPRAHCSRCILRSSLARSRSSFVRCMPWIIHQTGGPTFDVPTGRRDGLTSNLRDADVLPDAADSINVLRSSFAAAGLNDRDLVLLTGTIYLHSHANCRRARTTSRR